MLFWGREATGSVVKSAGFVELKSARIPAAGEREGGSLGWCVAFVVFVGLEVTHS